MIQAGFGKKVQHRADSAGFRVFGAKHHALEARMQHGAAAHDAGLKRHKKLAVFKSVIAQGLGGGAQRHDFGVRGRVMGVDGGVAVAVVEPMLFCVPVPDAVPLVDGDAEAVGLDEGVGDADGPQSRRRTRLPPFSAT